MKKRDLPRKVMLKVRRAMQLERKADVWAGHGTKNLFADYRKSIWPAGKTVAPCRRLNRANV